MKPSLASTIIFFHKFVMFTIDTHLLEEDIIVNK